MKRAKRILSIGLVGPVPPPAGGMAMQTLQLKRLLEDRGHKVSLIPVNEAYRPLWIEKLPILRAVFRLFWYRRTLKEKLSELDVVHLMANSGWSFHLFARPAVSVAFSLGVPIIINYRGGGAREFFNKSWKYVAPVFDKASSVVVPSGFLDEVFRDFGQDSKVIPNIVDLSLFQYRKPEMSKRNIVVIVTRNLEKIYDNETAIRAFAQFYQDNPFATLKIAGSGGELSSLENLVGELNIESQVEFLGRLNRADMVALYGEADIMLNPSTVDNMPNSVLEALASGTTVVTTNVGGIPYMVSDEDTVLMVPPSSPEDMAEAMQRLVVEPEFSVSMSKRGLDLVNSFQPIQVVPKLEALYLKVMK